MNNKQRRKGQENIDHISQYVKGEETNKERKHSHLYGLETVFIFIFFFLREEKTDQEKALKAQRKQRKSLVWPSLWFESPSPLIRHWISMSSVQFSITSIWLNVVSSIKYIRFDHHLFNLISESNHLIHHLLSSILHCLLLPIRLSSACLVNMASEETIEKRGQIGFFFLL